MCRQTETERKGAWSYWKGSVPPVSPRGQGWGSESSQCRDLESGRASGLGRLPELHRKQQVQTDGDPLRQAQSQEHNSLVSLQVARGKGGCLCRSRKADMEMNWDWPDSRLL